MRTADAGRIDSLNDIDARCSNTKGFAMLFRNLFMTVFVVLFALLDGCTAEIPGENGLIVSPIATKTEVVPVNFVPLPCPNVVIVEPPPCHTNGSHVTCTAPGPYWFYSKYGLGCAGALSNISVEMMPINEVGGLHYTGYILKFNLYTGRGFQKDQDGFHIDALLADGSVYRDILTLGSNNSPSTGGIQLNLDHCHYSPGQNFTVPPTSIAISPFDFRSHNISKILVRVDPAINVGMQNLC